MQVKCELSKTALRSGISSVSRNRKEYFVKIDRTVSRQIWFRLHKPNLTRATNLLPIKRLAYLALRVWYSTVCITINKIKLLPISKWPKDDRPVSKSYFTTPTWEIWKSFGVSWLRQNLATLNSSLNLEIRVISLRFLRFLACAWL